MASLSRKIDSNTLASCRLPLNAAKRAKGGALGVVVRLKPAQQGKADMGTDSDPDALGLSEDQEPTGEEAPAWRILVVDDEQDVHSVTNLILRDRKFLGRGVELLHAFSGQQARELVQRTPNIALVLLDVVMETDDAGLQTAKFIREVLGNQIIRIILRTGHPGLVSESQAISCGNDYYERKTDLTAERTLALIQMALTTYDALARLQDTATQLQQALHDMELFTDAIAHDIKAPARQVALFAELLVDEFGTEHSATAREYVDFMTGAATKLESMIDDLLHLSRLSHESMKFDQLQLDDVLNTVRTNLADQIRSTGAEVEAGPLGTVEGDARKLAHVLQNLLENALKYRSTDAPPRIHVSRRDANGTTLLSVADNGVGIHPGDLKHIFLPFRRGANADSVPGSGIGLAISKKIVGMHGGDISVTSEPGKGSTFQISLPKGRQ